MRRFGTGSKLFYGVGFDVCLNTVSVGESHYQSMSLGKE